MTARRHAVVTGAASGIGRATAQALREQGYRITAVDRHDPTEVADAWVEFDFDGDEAKLPYFEAPIDILVNAAGLPPRDGSEAAVLRVNFLALRRFTLHVVPSMPQGGAIVNVASKAGARWRENVAQGCRLIAQPDATTLKDFVRDEAIDAVRAYDLSKEAVILWTKAMTGPLLARGLRMNCVSPAAIETPILEDFMNAFGARASRGIDMVGRAGTPREVANVISFLAGPQSHWLRGCDIETDGGLTAMLETEKIIGPEIAQITGTPSEQG